MNKKFAIDKKDLVALTTVKGTCLATDRITVDGEKIGYMYREWTRDREDSGWRFFAGDESPEYIDDDGNTGVYDLNILANYDQAIVPLLKRPAPCTYEKTSEKEGFIEVDE
jgi:hypothetical protein